MIKGKKAGVIMSYVLTNGRHYIKMSDTGKMVKTSSIDDAKIYLDTHKAKEKLERFPGKTKGYYIFDVDSGTRYRVSNGRIHFPPEVRKLIYNTADGRCVLCGRKISYDSMTLDHINPLSMGGIDSVENLQCTCKACNQFKGSVLPDDFLERIEEIFKYQMGRKYHDKLRWKIVHRLLKNLT